MFNVFDHSCRKRKLIMFGNMRSIWVGFPTYAFAVTYGSHCCIRVWLPSPLFCLSGFGENCRVLEWILKRCDSGDVADESPIGFIPKPGTINTEGLPPIDMEKLFEIPKDYWLEECNNLRTYYEEQLGEDLPQAVLDELNALEERLKAA